ncbi:quinone oxidoreductase family protein [Actinacidiphila acididurans]|uniref:Zinc-binding dehydrogenase n=1 Tax=Actinacidiphila acididurans TaxID=2784346 RepID=A0ABS2U0K1_9ACTN|nr:zinc-binding dehydrogenase [Actinacidiphila acididurans]MBM9508552.1 zinc-binding dehydrogenase [Actinacidiphila acididurans]
MRAIVIEEFGGPEVLTTVELPEPDPGPGEVTIDVAFAGVNFADIKARADGYRVPKLPFRPGMDVSGTVRAVGDGVSGIVPGQEVAAFMRGGGYAQIAVAPAATVFPLPHGVSLRTAAALPTVLPTAYALLHEIGRLREGDTVLIHSAAGGVGTIAGQLARMGGASGVYGTVSSLAKAEHALKSGYDQVFEAADFDADVLAVTGGRGVDLALDSVGGETFHRTLQVLARFGRLVNFGNARGAEPWQTAAAEIAPRAISVAGFSMLSMAGEDPQALRTLAERAFSLLTDSGVELPITAEFPLEEAGRAHELVESRTTTGKLLLRVPA